MRRTIRLAKQDRPGKLIAVCGTDGSGKTTQIELLREYLTELGEEVLLTKQPTDLSRQHPLFLRYIYHPEERDQIDYRALICLMIGDRLQHVHEVILPALARGEFVITDRYIFTMLATMRAREYRSEWWVYDLCRQIPNPDATLLFDAPLSIVEARIRTRKTWEDAYVERMHLERTQLEFRALAEECDIHIIDTSDSDPQSAFQKVKAIASSLSNRATPRSD